MERRSLCDREYRYGPHPSYPRENRNRCKKSKIFKGGVGNWIQDRENGLTKY